MTEEACRESSGFVLPAAVLCVLLIALIVGGLSVHVVAGSRLAEGYMAGNRCRNAAQTALEREKAETQAAMEGYYLGTRSPWMLADWFSSASADRIGTGGHVNEFMRDEPVGDCAVTVVLTGVSPLQTGVAHPGARLTLQATASCRTAGGRTVSRTIEETVRHGLDPSRVFDYAYFVNNFGWFQGNGCIANGDIRANGNMQLDSYSLINGSAYAAINSLLNANGTITILGGGTTRHQTLADYRRGAPQRARPTNPASDKADEPWPMGYDGESALRQHGDVLDMPYLGDLAGYIELAESHHGTIRQQNRLLVDACYDGPGPSGQENGPDKGCLILDGTQHPIEISGPVVVKGDVIIKGTVTGQGAIYAGRNIHIIGNLTYKHPPSWNKPDNNPTNTAKQNIDKDMIALAAKGNIVLGDYTAQTWQQNTRNYITPPFVAPYACDASDADIGYPAVFDGDYTARDGGEKLTVKTEQVYNPATRKYEWVTTYGRAARKYYESAIGDTLLQGLSPTTITQIDSVLYNNHAIMGTIGQCVFNGSLVCRDEGIIYNSSVTFNWDIRLGSRSKDSAGMNLFVYMPLSPSPPQVVSWRELP
jgi:hypothetical protein